MYEIETNNMDKEQKSSYLEYKEEEIRNKENFRVISKIFGYGLLGVIFFSYILIKFHLQ